MPKLFDYFQMMMRGEVAPPPVSSLIGFKLISLEPGEAVIELEATEQHANAMGTLHGGILCDIADAAMAIAYAGTLSDDESFTTVELKINFLKPTRKAKLRAEGRVVKVGSKVGLVECDVVDGDRQLVAKALGTFIRWHNGQEQDSMPMA